MKTKKIVLTIPFVIICLLVLVVGYSACWIATHCDSIFNIGNNFDEPVTVYFEGQKMGEVNSGESKIFCLDDVLTTSNTDLLLDLKSNSGETLFSRLYTWEELTDVLESVKGQPYWISGGK